MDQSSTNQERDEKLELFDSIEGEDRISSLPDAILSHILSFIPTISAVQTSILSTRWKSLWTFVPCFDFCNFDWKDYPDDETPAFMNFVDKVLLLHKLPYINKFHLFSLYGEEHDSPRINSWIRTAVKLNVQELVLDLNYNLDVSIELPRSLFISFNLAVLKLVGDVFFWAPTLVLLPSLKILHLHSLVSLDDDSFKNLLSGSPVLEELDIVRGVEDNIKSLRICSSTLKKLCIVNPLYGGEDSFKYGFVIKTPALEVLKLNLPYFLTECFDVVELPSLVKANLNVSFPHYSDSRFDHYCNIVVGKMSKVQHLTLFNGTIKVIIQASSYNQLLFHDLTRLHMQHISDIPWSILIDLLGYMPNLKVLYFEKNYKKFQSCLWRSAPVSVPKCLTLCLETIEFRGFDGSVEAMKLVSYLLENAWVLKKLTLISRTRDNEIKQNIRKFPRSSSTCQIEFRYFSSRGLPSQEVEWL